MDYQHFRVEIRDHIALITFENPPVNAVSVSVRAEMPEVFRTTGHDPEVRVVIFTGAGERAFCGGTDVREFGQFKGAAREAREIRWRECLDAIYGCPAPVIGAINGPALGAGLALAAVCDLLIASEKAAFGLPEIRVGALGGGRHLARLVPEMVMRRMMFTGVRLTAREMAHYGAVSQVVPPAELLPAARALANEIAGFAPLALRLGKESLNRTEFMPMAEGYKVEQTFTARLQETEDALEARTAFLEKRAPVFKGR
jgi:enoyl-CoA hydratase